MVHTKVFVGNLSFKTKREDLAAEFGAAGKVVDANIITRGPRSLGYGFVEMESEEDAQKAVSIMNKKPVDNREINVELAKPRDETKIGERRSRDNARPRRPRRNNTQPRRFSSRDGKEGGENNRNQGSNQNNSPSKEGGGGGGSGSGSSSSSSSSNNNNNGDDKGDRPRRFRRRSYRGSTGGRGGRRSLAPRKETETSLFVANLPFALDDAALSDLYKEYTVKSAHVVKNRNGKSKGFGFVELATQAEQKAALEATNGKKVDGRDLIVKIALTSVEQSKVDGEPAKPAAKETTKEEPKEESKDAK